MNEIARQRHCDEPTTVLASVYWLLYNPSGPSAKESIGFPTFRSWASSKTVALIFSIRTAISQPWRFCPFVARFLKAGGE